MEPKMSTRMIRLIALDGWNELEDIYGELGSHGSGLFDQYFCHFDAFIESEWNIEKGRPDVSYLSTIRALCNTK